MTYEQQLRNQLIHYFRIVGSGQNMIQCIKEVLFSHQFFNPVLIFQKLSKGKQGISSKNWRDYILSINLSFNERQFKYFMKHNGYKSQVNLNIFLESIIPYNGDVLREYKRKCSNSIKIIKNNKQVEYIFAELIEQQFKFIRKLINSRDAISSIAGLENIQKLIKNDLLHDLKKKGMVREHRKLLEIKGFKPGFQELRTFIKVGAPEKVQNDEIELYMLNVMRHLKSNDPFCKIIFNKKRKELAGDNSTAKRSQSHQHSSNDDLSYTSKQKKTVKAEQSPYSKHTIKYVNDSKYDNFKEKLLEEFQEKKKKEVYRDDGNVSNKKGSFQNTEKKEERESVGKGYFRETQFSKRPQTQKSSRYSRINQSKYGGNLSFRGEQKSHNEPRMILNFFEEMLTKQEKIELLRMKLAKNNDFNLINLFKLIDNKNKGYVTSIDIAGFPEIKKAPYQHMLNFYGKQKDKLLFHEFCQIFRPLSHQLNDAIDSRPQNKILDPFKRQTRELIIEILKLTAQEHFNLNKMREAMKRINPQQSFLLMDVQNKRQLDFDNLLTVFKKYNIHCDEKSLQCLMRMFRKKINGKISFSDFAKFLEL